MNKMNLFKKLIIIPTGICLSFSCTSKKEVEKPNILFLLAEDLQPWLGAYGHDEIQTPNLDKLASRGVTFNKAYSNSPMCLPSRTSLLTGLHPRSTMTIENNLDWRKYVPDVPLLTGYLQENGYETVRIGKIAHQTFPDSTGWSEVLMEYEESWGAPVKEGVTLNEPAKPVPEALKYVRDSALYGYLDVSLKWGASGLKEQEEIDYRMAGEASEYLSRGHDKPFFLAVGFSKAHLPITVPVKYLEMYENTDISLPEYPKNDLEDVPSEAYWHFQATDHDRLTRDEWKEILKSYYASITFLDACVGEILSALSENNLDDNTVVVFASDHGIMLGEHFLWRKELLFEEAVRVPMIIKYPGVAREGEEVNGITEFYDLYPTFVEIAGLPVPEHVQGASLLPFLKDPGLPGKSHTVSIVKQGDRDDETVGYSIRTRKWRYTEWSAQPGRSELYDHYSDSKEIDNLSAKEEYDSVKTELRNMMYYFD